jgi:hypothetical protein
LKAYDKYGNIVFDGTINEKGEATGFMIHTDSNGNVYEGIIVNNLKDGKGKFTYANGNVYVSGTFVFDCIFGLGSSNVDTVFSVGTNDAFVAKYKSDDEWIEHLAGYSIGKPVDEWVDQDFNKAQLNLEEMVRHFIMTDRLYTIRDKHKDSKIVDIAIFEGKNQQRASKFYFSKDTKSNVVEETAKEIQKLMISKNLSETDKGEITLMVLKELMSGKEQINIKKKIADE